MHKTEEKMICWISRHMLAIAAAFVIFSALWMRLAGRNYMGIDYHFSLYDIPGNCNSFLFRKLAGFSMERWPDYTILLLKISAYFGDFGVALLTCFLLREKMTASAHLQVFLALTACLLSPVSLLYSVVGLRIDSVCMCILLLGWMLCQKGRLLLSLLIMATAAFLFPACWPIVILLSIYEIKQHMAPGRIDTNTILFILLLLCILLFSLLLENRDMANGYFWGKVFVIDPATGTYFNGFLVWLPAMFRIYGYFLAMSTLLLSFRHKKMRIPALGIQLLVLMLMGWYQTKYFAL